MIDKQGKIIEQYRRRPSTGRSVEFLKYVSALTERVRHVTEARRCQLLDCLYRRDSVVFFSLRAAADPFVLTYITGLSFGRVARRSTQACRVRLTVLAPFADFIVGFSAVFISLGALAGLASSGPFRSICVKALAGCRRSAAC